MLRNLETALAGELGQMSLVNDYAMLVCDGSYSFTSSHTQLYTKRSIIKVPLGIAVLGYFWSLVLKRSPATNHKCS